MGGLNPFFTMQRDPSENPHAFSENSGKAKAESAPSRGMHCIPENDALIIVQLHRIFNLFRESLPLKKRESGA
ncbi:hypothetical protein GCWU000341_01482 [Oribacterium sp. oral taxon 078 str. F0262]|nr:hypothetical protein GCWU000341_01482 [Oribacterium sp. oral taxon 078 str. F0262]